MRAAILVAILSLVVSAAYLVTKGGWEPVAASIAGNWQRAVVPGDLSASHSRLDLKCSTCHSPLIGVARDSCVGCHALDTDLLRRQPTAFHADIQQCTGCHLEHLAGGRMPTGMDHTVFAVLAARALPAGHPAKDRGERGLDCMACHGTKDRHRGRMGADCVQCHSLSNWTVAGFRHPSPRSTECAQCHKEPPSHNMGHFAMMSARIAGQPGAKVEQCFLCHQTTSWNDIKGVGLVKHH